MNYWANRLNVTPAPPVPPPAPVSNLPWWTLRAAVPVAPAPAQQPLVAPQTAAPVDENGQVSMGDLLHRDAYTVDTTKVKSARDTETCPECDSNNYMTPSGHPNVAKRCFDCGYNPLFTQSMSGVSGTGQNIPVKAARVQQLSVNNFNPGTIVGHA